MIEKILERLEEEREIAEKELEKCIFKGLPYHDSTEGKIIGIKEAIEIVKEVAEEYNGGWIPCSDTQKCLNVSKWCARYFWVTLRRTSSKILFTEKLRWIGYMNRWEWCNGRELSNDYEVIAWREYFSPEPYQPKGE